MIEKSNIIIFEKKNQNFIFIFILEVVLLYVSVVKVVVMVKR